MLGLALVAVLSTGTAKADSASLDMRAPGNAARTASGDSAIFDAARILNKFIDIL